VRRTISDGNEEQSHQSSPLRRLLDSGVIAVIRTTIRQPASDIASAGVDRQEIAAGS
jgi:hypothetical protein